MDSSRVLVFSPQDEFLFEIAPYDIFDGRQFEAINGQHYLNLTTTVMLRKEQRVLTNDDTGKWYEHVVSGEDAKHQSGERPFGEYHCVWSLQHDLSVTTVSQMPGVQNPVTASQALDAVLSGTHRWVKGTVTRASVGGASMYQTSGWKATSTLLEVWGGELGCTIEVSGHHITARKVDLYERIGSQQVTRRFDYGRDMSGISRDVDEAPVACRIIPRGKGEQTGDGYGRKITIEDVNDGIPWLQNDDSADDFKLPVGDGTYEYPTVYVDNESIDDPIDLLNWGRSVLDDYTTPRVIYTSDVIQLATAGMDPHGVSLGDVVQTVDRAFEPTPLRVSGRVTEISRDIKNKMLSTLKIGYLKKSVVSGLSSKMSSVIETVEGLSGYATYTADYLENILDNVNRQLNATGGYWYLVQGQGVRTYDKEVTDPLTGDEAESVVEMKGGSIRIANSRTASGEWDWRTVLVSGHIAADMVTAVNATFGFIGNPDGGTYWNLDTGEFHLSTTTLLGDSTVQEVIDGIDDARRYATDYLTYESGELTLGASDSIIKNVLTNQRMSFRTNAGDVAWFGLNDNGIWELFIDTASVRNRLSFGNFSWIARQNGNMTLKWIGDV